MKKRTILTAIAGIVTTAVLFAFAGCAGQGVCNVDSIDDAIVITADKSPANAGGFGHINVDDGAEIVITPALDDKGSVTVEFFLMRTEEGEQSIDKLPDEITAAMSGDMIQAFTGSSAAAQTLTVTGTDPHNVEVEAGEYTVLVTVAKGTTGKVVITTEGGDPETSPSYGDGSVNETDFDGTWGCGRCTIEIAPKDDGHTVDITWGSSAAEVVQWHYFATFDGMSLVDEGTGVKETVTWNEDGTVDSTVTNLQDLAASFSFNENGRLIWTDYKENAAADLEFEIVK